MPRGRPSIRDDYHSSILQCFKDFGRQSLRFYEQQLRNRGIPVSRMTISRVLKSKGVKPIKTQTAVTPLPSRLDFARSVAPCRFACHSLFAGFFSFSRRENPPVRYCFILTLNPHWYYAGRAWVSIHFRSNEHSLAWPNAENIFGPDNCVNLHIFVANGPSKTLAKTLQTQLRRHGYNVTLVRLRPKGENQSNDVRNHAIKIAQKQFRKTLLHEFVLKHIPRTIADLKTIESELKNWVQNWNRNIPGKAKEPD